jgi:tetratricopeptide (TPR) repeat protein
VKSWNACRSKIHRGLILAAATTAVILIGLAPANAQWLPTITADRYVQEGIQQVYNFELDAALESFERVVELHPRHPGGYFFVAMVDWMQILVEIEDESRDEEFFAKLERVIYLSDELLKQNSNNVGALFFKGGAIGFRGRLRSHRGSWMRAANDGRRALPIVRRAERLAPENADVLLGMGIYNYYAEVVPEMFPWVRPFMLFFPSGDREAGIEQLRRASMDARYAGVEASYFLMQILYFNEKRYREGYEIAANLHERFPNNPLFHRYYGRFSVSLGRWNEAYTVFSEVIERYHNNQRGYYLPAVREANYYVAQYLFNNNRLEEALRHYTSVLEYSDMMEGDQQMGFVVLSRLRRGMIYDLLDQREAAVAEYQKVQTLNDYQGSRALAERYLENPYTRGGRVRDINPNTFAP